MTQKILRIGIDFDGVLVDTEADFRYHMEKHMYEQGIEPATRHNRNALKNYEIDDLSDLQDFFIECFCKDLTMTGSFFAGAKEVLQMLRKRGHKLFLVTARGKIARQPEIQTARARLDEFGFKFDGEFWEIKDKSKVCLDNGLDVLVDDCNENCVKSAAAGIKTLYFRDRGIEKLDHPNITEVDNWFHIYKEILKFESLP